jgi:hypothetical protein
MMSRALSVGKKRGKTVVEQKKEMRTCVSNVANSKAKLASSGSTATLARVVMAKR